MRIRSIQLVIAGLLGTVQLAAPAFAEAPEGPSQVSKIVVTAQRREASLASTPLSLTVAAQPLLNDVGVRDIKDLQILTPGLVVASTSNQTFTTARIRGVGTVGDNPGLESSVGVMIDGVYRPRNGVALGDLGEVERIEVLKGPQATLFGKNTSAGVINIITERPSFDPSISGEITGGNYGAIGGSVSVTGGLTDQIAGRLFVAHRERDGFYDVDTGALLPADAVANLIYWLSGPWSRSYNGEFWRADDAAWLARVRQDLA